MIYKFFALSMLLSFGYSILRGDVSECINAVFEGVESAVALTMTLAGMLCFWNGAVSVIKESRALTLLSSLLSPIINFVFPSAAKDPDLRKKLSLFTCANALGLGNAATPIALSIMKDTDSKSDIPSNDAVMLCLTATAPISLIPTTVMSILKKSGSVSPGAVLPYVWASSFLSFLIAVAVGKIYCALRNRRKS